jgi:GNAT superfamily N-acetyltransferase
MPEIDIVTADLLNPAHQNAVLLMLDAYSADPMGDEQPLSDFARANLIDGLRIHPTTLIFLAMQDDQPLGIAVCFRGFSTFAAMPLLNLHDFYVDPQTRGHGIGRALLGAIEREARHSGCCKLTLEVQENNPRARTMYGRFGFAQAVYAADAKGGGTLFMTKLVT